MELRSVFSIRNDGGSIREKMAKKNGTKREEIKVNRRQEMREKNRRKRATKVNRDRGEK